MNFSSVHFFICSLCAIVRLYIRTAITNLREHFFAAWQYVEMVLRRKLHKQIVTNFTFRENQNDERIQ